MRRTGFLLIGCLFWLICRPTTVSAQTDGDMDELARDVPDEYSRSVKSLADYFKNNIAYDRGRIRAIYAWITQHIRYLDTNNGSEIWATREHIFRQRPDQVLKNRSAVCQGVANLFQALAEASDIPCQVIPGIAKGADGEVPATGHAWVAALIQGEWRLFDPTWCLHQPGQGWEVNDYYFMTPPEIFIRNHLPDDPAWQLLEHPITETAFRENDADGIRDLLNDRNQPVFRYQDTIRNWIQLDSTERLKHSIYRILTFNGNNQRVIFGLGQSFWGQFLDLLIELDSTVDRAIMEDAYTIDTTAFTDQLAGLNRYQEQAQNLFGLLTDERRLAQAEKFYSPRDVTAISAHLSGSLWTAAFEDELTRLNTEGRTDIPERLPYYLNKAAAYYTRARERADCQKLPNICYEIYHNLSLTHLQLAERYLKHLRLLVNADSPTPSLAAMDTPLLQADRLLKLAGVETEELLAISPPYAFKQERLLRIRQDQFTRHLLEIASRRRYYSDNLNTAVVKTNSTAPDSLFVCLEQVAVAAGNLAADAEDAIGDLGMDFCLQTMLQLRQEALAMQCNLGSLKLRQMQQTYLVARKNNNVPYYKKTLLAGGQAAQVYAQNAAATLALIQNLKGVSAYFLEQKAGQLQQLNDAIRQFLAQL